MASISIKLKNVRLAFPSLFEPAPPYEPGGQAKFTATFLIPKKSENFTIVEDAIKKVAAETWGKKADAVLKSIANNNMKYAFQDGDNKSDYDGYEGHYYLTAKNTSRPEVRDRDASPLTAADGRPYGGCFVVAYVDIYTQIKNGNALRASLKGVQFYKDGEAFAGGSRMSADEFEVLTDEEDDLV